MNSSLGPLRVLCYGDSNTWGFDHESKLRFPSSVRWTGVLQSLLGASYLVIEEGLNGRTTDLDNPERFGRNGKNYLPPCVESHYPLDVVILALGTNDLKANYRRSAQDILKALRGLVEIIRGKQVEAFSPDVKIILVGPAKIDVANPYYENAFAGAEEKLVELTERLPNFARENRLTLVSLYGRVEPGHIDGVHFARESHTQIAQLLHEAIQNI